MWWQLAVVLATTAWAVHYLTSKYYKQAGELKLRRQLASASARWHLQHQQDSPGVLIENVPMGWLNLLLQALWVPVLEKHIAGLVMNALQRLLTELHVKRKENALVKRLEFLRVESCGLGLVPPRIRSCSARYDPNGALLVLLMDVKFVTSGAELLLAARTKANSILPALDFRLEATHVSISGKMRLGLQFCREAPGLKGLQYSFVEAPELDLVVRPLGSASFVSDLRFVVDIVRDMLSKVITKQLTEPQRRAFDIQRMYMEKHIARAGGPGGLVVLLVRAANLQPTNSSSNNADAGAGAAAAEAAAAGAAGKAKGKGKPPAAPAVPERHSLYCEVRYGRMVLRTPITHTTTLAATWDWQLSLPLAEPLQNPSAPSPSGSSSSAGGGAAAALPAAALGVRGSSPEGAVAAAAGKSSTGTAAATGGVAGASLAPSINGGVLSAAAAAPPAAAGTQPTDDVVRVLVYDAAALGDPLLLARGKLNLNQLGLVPGAAPSHLLLPLTGAGAGASIHLELQWLQSRRRRTTQGGSAPAPAAAPGTAAAAVAAAIAADVRHSACAGSSPTAAADGAGVGRPSLESLAAAQAAAVAATAGVKPGHGRSKSVSAVEAAGRGGTFNDGSQPRLRLAQNPSAPDLPSLGAAAAASDRELQAEQQVQAAGGQQQQQMHRLAGQSGSPTNAGAGWLRSKLAAVTVKGVPPQSNVRGSGAAPVEPAAASTLPAAGPVREPGAHRRAIKEWFKGRSMHQPQVAGAAGSPGQLEAAAAGPSTPAVHAAAPNHQVVSPGAAGRSPRSSIGSRVASPLPHAASSTAATDAAAAAAAAALSISGATEAALPVADGPTESVSRALTRAAAEEGATAVVRGVSQPSSAKHSRHASLAAPADMGGGLDSAASLKHSRHTSFAIPEDLRDDSASEEPGVDSEHAASFSSGRMQLQQQAPEQRSFSGYQRPSVEAMSGEGYAKGLLLQSGPRVSPLAAVSNPRSSESPGPLNPDGSSTPGLMRPISAKQGSIVAVLGALSRGPGSMAAALMPSTSEANLVLLGGPTASLAEDSSNHGSTHPEAAQRQQQQQPLSTRSSLSPGPAAGSSSALSSMDGSVGASTTVLLTLTQQKRQLAMQAAELVALREQHQQLLLRYSALAKVDTSQPGTLPAVAQQQEGGSPSSAGLAGGTADSMGSEFAQADVPSVATLPMDAVPDRAG